MLLGMEVGHAPGHIVLDGNPAPLPKKGPAKRLDASIKMPLGMEVGLSPGDFVLEGTQPLPKKRRSPPQF